MVCVLENTCDEDTEHFIYQILFSEYMLSVTGRGILMSSLSPGG